MARVATVAVVANANPEQFAQDLADNMTRLGPRAEVDYRPVPTSTGHLMHCALVYVRAKGARPA
jgi:hypothetical protein